MKKLSRILAIVLSLVLCLGLLAVTGYAAEESPLALTLTTDKEEYVVGDQVIVTLEAKNNGETNLKNVNMTIKAPEGLNTADATKALETLAAGASAKLEATYQIPLPENPETGDSGRIVLVAVLGLLAVAAMVGLTWNRRSAAMVLALVMVLGLATLAMPANAAEASITETATVNVKVNGQKYPVTATVTAEIEEKEDSEQPPVDEPEKPAGQTYTKVTEDLEDWTGTYLIVCDDPSVMKFLDATQVKTGAGVDFTLTDGKIVGDYAAYTVKVTKTTGSDGLTYWHIQLPNGNYLSADILSGALSEGAAMNMSISAEYGLEFSGFLMWMNGKFAFPSFFVVGNGISTSMYKLEEIPAEPEQPTEQTYTKVTEDLEDWTGTYLIVCDDPSVMKFLDTTQVNTGAGIDFTLTDGKIVGDYAAYTVKVTKPDDSGYYNVMLPGGKYMSTNLLSGNITAGTATKFEITADYGITLGGPLQWMDGEFAFPGLAGGSGISTSMYKLEEIPTEPEEPIEQTYVKVTEDLEDWTGTYLLVCDDPSVMKFLDATQVAAGAGVDFTLTDGKIVGKYAQYAVKVTKTIGNDGETYWHIQLANGNYLSADIFSGALSEGAAMNMSISAEYGLEFSGFLMWMNGKFAFPSFFVVGNGISTSMYKLAE